MRSLLGRLRPRLPLPVLTLVLGGMASAQVHFTEVTVAAGLLPTTKAGVVTSGMRPGAAVGDFDRDGLQDLFILGGNLRDDQLFINNGDGTFRSEGQKWGIARRHRGGGASVGDYDEDGDQDILITTPHLGQLRLYRNDQTTGHHWLRIRLDTSGSAGLAPDGYGTRLELRTGADWQVRVLDVGCNYLSTSEPVISFGLGYALVIDELVVYWNDGTVTKQTNLSVDQLLVVKNY